MSPRRSSTAIAGRRSSPLQVAAALSGQDHVPLPVWLSLPLGGHRVLPCYPRLISLQGRWRAKASVWPASASAGTFTLRYAARSKVGEGSERGEPAEKRCSCLQWSWADDGWAVWGRWLAIPVNPGVECADVLNGWPGSVGPAACRRLSGEDRRGGEPAAFRMRRTTARGGLAPETYCGKMRR